MKIKKKNWLRSDGHLSICKTRMTSCICCCSFGSNIKLFKSCVSCVKWFAVYLIETVMVTSIIDNYSEHISDIVL